MSLFKLKKRGGPRDLEVSMVGLKLGSAVLQLGQDEQLVTALAKVVGISGETSVAVESEEDAKRMTQAAASAGLLIDVKITYLRDLPFTADMFDVVVVSNLLGYMGMNERVLCLQQLLRVLKPSGRCVIIESTTRGGLGALLSQRMFNQTYLSNGGAQGALTAEGFRAVRLLAEQKGKSFFEGTK